MHSIESLICNRLYIVYDYNHYIIVNQNIQYRAAKLHDCMIQLSISKFERPLPIFYYLNTTANVHSI